MESLPGWLDINRIGEIAFLTIALMQFFKTKIPSKYIWMFQIALAIGISFGSVLYMGASISLVKGIIDGLIAAVTAELGYQFFSKTSGPFTLPSKGELIKKEEVEAKRVEKVERAEEKAANK